MPSLKHLIVVVAVAAACGESTPDTLMGPGVSLELARVRAATVSKVRYDLALDLTRPALDTATGSVTIDWHRTGNGDAIVDFRGPGISLVVANGDTIETPEFNGAHLRIPARSLKDGDNSVHIAFTTLIAPAGASIIKAHDPDGSDYLYTLLVPADANQLFPCFDQPDLKANVTLSLTTRRDWVAVSNGSVDRIETTSAADSVPLTFRFKQTNEISTYLIAFAAGPWERRSSTMEGRTINLFARKSRIAEADTDTLLALNHRALAWMESYFGRPYPFEKYDMVLAPAFPFGGMEHPGAVFYNENSFIFREPPTPARRLGRFSTILHEVAHQWFGDLVTMRWFDDLWLKEGFATYMAAKAMSELDSASGAWKTFYQNNKPSAYAVDQTAGTNSLWQELANLDQAKSNYGAIVYNKAPSVLKQLNYLTGDDAFQRGVRGFLARHAYANATWQDLLAAIGDSAGRSFEAFGEHFMLRAGMPVVEQRLTVADGRITKLELAQRPAQSGVSGDEPWPMKTEVLLSYAGGEDVRIPIELSGAVTEVAEARGRPAPAFVFANANDHGYFLTILDSGSVDALESGAIRNVRDPLLRTMLWGALWDLVRDARLDPARFAALALRELEHENDEQIFPNVIGRLNRALSAYLSSQARDSLVPRAEAAFWRGSHDASRPFGVRRAYLDAFTNVAQSQDALARLASLLSAPTIAGDPIRDPTRWDIVTRLMLLEAPRAREHLARQAERDTTPDGRRRRFIAGAGARDSATKARYFDQYFSDGSLNEEWASGSLGAFNAPEHAALTLPYLRAALDSLPYIQKNRRIFFLGSWLGAFIGGHRSQEALDIVNRYLEDNPGLAIDLRRKVLQTVDELARTVAIRARWP